jgi:sugar-specific transcriptional regulator TrmB
MFSKTQKDSLKKALLQFNLNDKEILIYLAVLKNKDTILDIAKETSLSRGTVYDIVEKLKTQQFLSETKLGKKRRIILGNPISKFYSLLDTKHHEFEKAKNLVEEVLPIIKSIHPDNDFKPQIRIYYGAKGFKQVWEEIFLAKDKQWLSIAKLETFIEFGGEDFFEEILTKKIKLKFKSKAIHENSPLAQKFFANEARHNRETKLTPKEFAFPSTEIIWDNKIAMFSTEQENIILVIESHDFSQTHRTYFEMLWQTLK